MDSSGETIWYDYDGTKLSAVRVEYKDTAQNLVSRTTVRYTYDPQGRLKTVVVDLTPEDNSITDLKTYTTTYAYDGNSKRVKSLRLDDRDSLDFTYELVGGVYRVKSAIGSGTRMDFTYDLAARRTTVTDEFLRQWQFDYDTAGQLVRQVSPSVGSTTITQTYAYDVDGNVIQAINGDGEVTTMAYDANGNQVRVTDAKGQTTTRTYNQRNQLVSETVSTATTPKMVAVGGIGFDGADIVKTGTTSAWDASVRSGTGLVGGASVSFKVGQDNKPIIVGLTTNPWSHGWSGIEYALYCTSGSKLEVRESGSGNRLTTVVSYAAGDELRVTYGGGKVTYLKNGVAFWTTTGVSIPGEVYADTSFYGSGGRISDLSFGATATTGIVPLVAPSNAFVDAAGNVSKSSGFPGIWDASVRSLAGFTGGAAVSFQAGNAGTNFMVGLTSDPTANDSYNTIDYALYCASNSLWVYENGVAVDLGSPAYTPSDVLRIVYDGTKVQYLKINSSGTTVLRTVTVSIASPLYLDTSLYSSNAQIASLSFGKTVSELKTVVGVVQESLVKIDGDTVSRVGGPGKDWDSSVRSVVGYVGGASLSFSPAQSDKNFMIGLNTDPGLSYSYTKLDYAFYLKSNGQLELYESDVAVPIDPPYALISYTPSDRLQITYDGANVRYLWNGIELRKTAASINGPLYVDSSFYDVGASVTGLRFSDQANPNLQTIYVYQENSSRLAYSISPQGRVTRNIYSASGVLVAQVTYTEVASAVPRGTVVDGVWTPPTEQRLNTWCDAQGSVLSKTMRRDFVYDSRGLVRLEKLYTAIDSQGNGVNERVTQYVYDQAGRLLQKIEQASATDGDTTGTPVTTYTYDGLGRVLTVTDPRGATTTTVYTQDIDNRMLKVEVSDQAGAKATSTYDSAGRLTSVVRGTVAIASYKYDQAGRVLMTTLPSKDATNQFIRSFNLYDEVGRLVGTVDGNGTLTETSYDRAGRIIRVYTYSTSVPLASLTDGTNALNPSLASIRPSAQAADLARLYVYDDDGRLAFEMSDSYAVTEYIYDAAGRKVESVRHSVPIAPHSSPSWAYVRSQLEQPAVQAGAADDRHERYFYDSDGNLAGTLDAEGYLTTHQYDGAGQLRQTRRYTQAVSDAGLLKGGVLSSLVDSISGDAQLDNFFYDARGLQIGHVDALGYITRTWHNTRGEVIQQARYSTAVVPPANWKTANVDDLINGIRTNGKLIASDRWSSWRYGLGGELLTTRNHEGVVTTYHYDAQGRLTEEIRGAGLVDQREILSRYDLWGRKTAELSAEGAALITDTMTAAEVDAIWATWGVDYTYDDEDRLISQTDAKGFKTLFFYDADGHLTHSVNARGEVEEHSYNTLGQLVSSVRYGTAISVSGLTGGTASSVLQTRLAAIADASLDSKTGKAYDYYGRLKLESAADGAQTDILYNTFDEVVERRVPWQSGANLNASKRVDRWTYDHRGLVTATVMDAAGLAATTETAYDAFGRVVASTDAVGSTTKYEYDKLGRQIVVTNPLNKTTKTTYDAYGQQLSVTDALGHATTYSYDHNARTVTVTSPENVVVTTTHSVFGQTLSIKDGNGNLRSFIYDHNGNLTQEKLGSAIVDSREYDVADRLVATTDANGVRTTYTYDAANRMLTRTVDPTDDDTEVELALQTKWAYDAKGQAVTVTDPRGTVTQFSFDLAGRTIKQVLDPSGLAITTQWTLNADGQAVSTLDANGVETRYTFDTLGRRVREVQDYGTGHLNITRSYTYDDQGQLLTSTDPNGNVTRYGYDDAGRQLFAIDALGGLTYNDYDAAGHLTARTRYAKPWTSAELPDAKPAVAALDQVTQFVYDDDGRQVYTVDAMGSVTAYVYDSNGNVISASRLSTLYTGGTPNADTNFTRTVNDRTDRFAFDAFNRQTRHVDAVGAYTENRYDAAGNVIRVTRYACLSPGVDPRTTGPTATSGKDRVVDYSYDSANRLTYTVDAIGFVSLNSYDKAGNILSTRRFADLPNSRSTPETVVLDDALDRTQTYSYDRANRRVWMKDAIGGTENYTYDAAGNRLTFTNKNRATWTYTYDAANRLVQEDSPSVSLYSLTRSDTDGTLTLSNPTAESVTTKLTYDSAGNLKTRTEAAGRTGEERTTTYDYDKLNRQVKVTFPSLWVHSETTSELVANSRLGNDVRDEVLKTPTSTTWYDTFGNAVASVDRNGSSSFKAYDEAGRVRYEVDALGYITRYDRNAFGEVISQTRYATASSLANTAPTNADPGPSCAEIDAVVAGTDFTDAATNRTLQTSYDANGRVYKVTEPRTYVYVFSDTTDRSFNGSKQTISTYNAFGEVTQVAELVDIDYSTDPDTYTYQNTYHYYDNGGRRVATADAGGFLSTFAFDSEGNLVKQVEYAKKLTAWDAASYTLPQADAALDRTTTWTWDRLNRKLTETKANVVYYSSSTATNVTTTTSSLTTSFGYDAVGNQVYAQDAAGGETYTYFDALGRIQAIVAPTRTSTVDGLALLPVVEFRRDAHGNVLCKIERANTASNVSLSSYSVISDGTNDHWTRTLYDSSGNARQVHDALGYQHYSSYTADGQLAKSWQTVSDLGGVKQTVYTANYFDKLGRLINTYTPSPVAGAAVSTDYEYNAFGEVITRGKNKGKQEYFLYDNAGRLWKTNSGDGLAKVFLYDLLGRQTSDIRSAGSGRSGASNVDDATTPSTADNWGNTKRIDTKYDALGHVLARLEPMRQVIEGGVTVRKASTAATVATTQICAPNLVWEGETEVQRGYIWSGTNSATFTWTTLGYLGGGDIRVDLTYTTADQRAVNGSGPVTRTESQIFLGNVGETGLTMNWTGSASDRNAGIGGISAIQRLVVYKRDINGDFRVVIDRQPGASPSRPFGDWGTQVEVGAPVDPSTAVWLQYRLKGATDWLTAQLCYFGDSLWFDSSNLNGEYEYQVSLKRQDSVWETTESGSFKTKLDDFDDSAKTTNWYRPTVNYERDRWGNALSQSDPRNATWKTVYAYNRDNQIVAETQPDAANGDQNGKGPKRLVFYDKLGQQRAVQDARGYVNTTEHDAAGNLTREVHADGGKVTYFYDAFGQRVQMVDAVGNTTTDKNSFTYQSHTTTYKFDRLGRQTSATHGNVSTGSVWVYHSKTDMSGVTKDLARRNVVETFQYDELGRKVKQTNGEGQAVSYWYDRAGNIIKTQQPGGEFSTSEYDALGHKTKDVDANGNIATWGYSDFGQLQSHKDIGGAVYTYTYDAAGQLTKQTNDRNADGKDDQSLSYSYDASGQLTKIFDGYFKQTTTIAYDLAGHRLREKVLRGGQMFQDNHLSYDVLGRLVNSADDRAHVTFEYDLAGNRSKVATHVRVARVDDKDVEDTKDAQRYFFYDSMNRQLVIDGDAAGNISQTQGHVLTYDVNGNRLTDKFWGNRVTTTVKNDYYIDPDTYEVVYQTNTPVYTKSSGFVLETYSYDAYGQLFAVDRDGTLVDLRMYDAAGRVVQSGPEKLATAYSDKLNEGVAPEDQIGMEIRRQRYDANGRLLYQRVLKSDTSQKFDVDYEGTASRNGTVLGYDNAGNVLAYEFKNYAGGAYNNITSISLGKFEGYVELTKSTDSTKYTDGTTTSTYDANGFLSSIKDEHDATLNRSFVNDAAGRVLRVYQNGHNLYNSIVSGEVLGQFGVAPNEVDPRTDQNTTKFQQVVEFGLGYRSITGSYPAPSVGAYTVRPGDTLRGIASAALGDASQWWRVAQVNGLQSDNDLRVGQTLSLPSVVAGSTNNSESFKPYDPSDVVGDTSPNLPQPASDGGGCGALGQIIMIVVAVAVTYFTAGVATEALGGVVGELSGASVAGGALGAAAGSIASQAVGMAIGAQDSFSWKQVAAAAIGGGVTAGVTGAFGNTVSAFNNVVVKAAIANAMTQGISVACGLQDHFNWMGVAAAAVGAGVGDAVAKTVSGSISDSISNPNAAKVVTGALAGFASGATVAMMKGGRVSAQQIAADAFGNALGQGIVDASLDAGRPQREADAEYLRELNRAKSTQIQNMQPAYTGGSEWAADVRAARADQGGQAEYFSSGGGASSGPSGAAIASASSGGLTGLASAPEILFGTGQQTILPGSYGGDYTTWASGTSEQGIPQVEVTLHRGGLTRADEMLQLTQDAIDAAVQRTQDDGAAAYARGDKASAAMAALSYLPDRLVGDALKGIVGLPRLYTSDHMLPGLVNALANPASTVRAGITAFDGLSTQDKVVAAAELLGPAALKFGPGLISRANGTRVLGSELGNTGGSGGGALIGEGEAAAGGPSGASLPLGSKRLQLNQPESPWYQPIRNDPTTIGEIDYSGHAIDRMQDRGVMPSVVQNTIDTGVATSSRMGTTVYYDPVNNVSVVTNAQGKVVTVKYGR